MAAQEGHTESRNEKMSRRMMREHIFRLLFLIEFWPADEIEEAENRYFLSGYDMAKSDEKDIRDKFAKILLLIPEIDENINATSKGWKTTRMNKVDLSILRLAVYEILHDDAVPGSVAVNEAVELAKKFGGEESFSFVNGILASVIKLSEKE